MELANQIWILFIVSTMLLFCADCFRMTWRFVPGINGEESIFSECHILRLSVAIAGNFRLFIWNAVILTGLLLSAEYVSSVCGHLVV